MLREGVRSHDPEYLDPGAIIDYYLADGVSGEVTLEFLDASGNVIRGFTSSSDGYTYEERQEMRAPYVARTGDPALATGTGHHRFTWDLRHPGVAAPAFTTGLYGRPGANGPMVAPGHYQVRLTAGGVTHTQDLEVRIDPRVYADGISPADLQAQEALSLQIRDAVAEGAQAAIELEQLRRQVRAGSSDARQVEELWNQLVTRRTGSYPPPMLLDQLDYLHGMVTKADSRPSRDAYTRYADLKEMLDELVEQVRQLRRGVA
jgi:hypothetical protein